MRPEIEFGRKRTCCDCKQCKTNCQFMPGFLVPSDLTRLIPEGVDPLGWAEANLLASPGALVLNRSTGEMSRIPTLVPAVKPNGHCIYYHKGLCKIHEIAPFGCAFFDCKSGAGGSEAALSALWDAHMNQELYARIWNHLWDAGKRQTSPETLRKMMNCL